MGVLVTLAIVGSIIVAVSYLIYDYAEKDWNGCKTIFNKTKCLFVPYVDYDVLGVGWSSSFGCRSLVIQEDGVKIPIDCPDRIALKLEDIINLNGKDVGVSIRAKINRKTLRLVSIKGYMVKQ